MNYEEFKNTLWKEMLLRDMQKTGIPIRLELTPENARKNISFSLLNKEMNKVLLEGCPYKMVHDMVAIPRWHLSDKASFVVNNGIVQGLGMTREEILVIAQENTESANYICRRIEDAIKEVMLNSGFGGNAVGEKPLIGYSSLYVLSNPQMMDGSCAMLSGRFMKKAANQIGTDELYILPSSRHEILALDSHDAPDPAGLKLIVMAVNREPDIVDKEDFLSDSVYKYNAEMNTLSVWDNEGFFRDDRLPIT